MIAEAKYTSFGESREPPESSAPSPLDYPQWVAWRYEKRAGAKPSKPAYSPITTKKTSFSPEELCSYERALAFGPKEGVGFRLTETDPFTAIDLDHCVNPETGEISPRALEIIEALDSYTEISPSGTGVRIFVLAVKPEGFGQNKKAGIEVYDRDQYVTYTGSVLGERSIVRERQQAVEDLCEKHLPRKDGGESRAVRVSSGFSSAFASAATTPKDKDQNNVVHLEDHELLKKARAAGTGGEFSRLYDGGEILTGDGTHSDGDIALCGMLAYWTGCNPEQMDRLFRGSALMRPKWNTYRTENAERGRTAGTYGSQTIEKAVANCQQVYRGATEAGGQEDRARRLKEALAELETYSHALPWAGGNGPRKRFVYGALINTGGGYGELVSGGAEIKVCASHRQLALAAGIGSRDSVKKTLTELEGDDLIRIETPAKFTKKDTDQGIPKAEATTFFLLLDPPRTAGPPTYYPPRVNYYGPALRALLGRVRDDSPLIVPEVKRRSKNRKRTVTYVSYIDRVAPVEGSIGKLAALVLERICVAGSGGEAEADGVLLNELGCSLGRRGRDLRSRQIKVLLEHGFIVETEPGSDRYRPADDLCELLEAHLEETGTVRAEQRQKHRYEQEQGDFRLNRDLRGELRQQRKRDREATNLRGREYMTEIFDARAREDAARDEEAALQALTEQINHNAHKRKEIDEATQFVHEELTDLPTTAMPLGNMLERWKERGGKLGELMRGIEKAGAIVFREPLDRNHEHVSFPGVRDEEERKLRGIEQRRRAQKAEQRRTA